MNKFYINNKIIISQLLLGILLLCHSLYGITINNQPLNEIIEPGCILSYTSKIKDNCIFFEMRNDNINLIFDNINNLENLKEKFENIYSRKNNFTSFKSETFLNLSINFGDFNEAYLMGKEYIIIKTKTSINFINNILESPNISITGNQISFDDCFLINPKILYIITNSPKSNCKIIRITFNEECINPTAITGEINLENNQTTKELLLSNVKKIEIQFAPKAWDPTNMKIKKVGYKQYPSFLNLLKSLMRRFISIF